ncbi:MAG: SDR family NAD(P)-dependent oxidoreductase [bacterium]|jgi:NAD(P)-dependent dehydrogenase (short-subunit alcohol dehydrogenase family)|nr:SDR family NAD(P)-dependent oxidoreductase [bacterium]
MRTALVTGGNRGIGLALCGQLAQAGVHVLMGCRDEEAGAEALRAVAGAGSITPVELDVADPASIATCARLLDMQGQAVDILVNNAAVLVRGDALTVDETDILESLQVNLLGAWRCCRTFMPPMIARGWGRVVNVSSGWGSFTQGMAGPASYSVSKAALNALTVSLSHGLPPGVLVNAVSPGWVRTRMGGPEADRSPDEGARGLLRLALLPEGGPSGRFIRDEEEVGW